MLIRNIALFIHISGFVVWLGGMFFMLHCLRPAANQLEPALRLPLLVGAMDSFFRYVAVSLGLIWASGLWMMLNVGFANSPKNWHLMLATGLVMTVIFLFIWLVKFPAMQKNVSAGVTEFASAAKEMASIRLLVVVNMALGFLTVAIATIGKV